MWTRDPFPGNRIPADRINPRRRGRSCSTTRIRTTRPPASRRGSRTCTGPSTSTRTCSGTGSGRSTTTSARTTGSSSGGARTSGTRSATGERTPSAPVRPRAASFRSGAPTARSSATGCAIFGAGTVFNLRASYTYFLEWSYSEHAIGFDSTEFWPSSLVEQMPSQAIGGIFPVINIDQFQSMSRGSSPNRNRNYTIQPNVSMIRGKHNIRSGLDMRWTNVYQRELQQLGRQCFVQP